MNIIIKYISFVIILVSVLGFDTYSSFQQQEIKYKNYLNQKFGFSVDYPCEILIPEGESESGDGQVFRSKRISNNTLTVCRDYLELMDPDTKYTLEISFNKHVRAFSKKGNGRNITYKKLDKNFFVISGHKDNGDIYYQKTIMIDSNLCSCLLEYRQADKEIFNKISERVFKSFK